MRAVLRIATVFLGAITLATAARADEPAAASPFGVAGSASSYRDHAEWFPKMATAGVTQLRYFPEWQSVQKSDGSWDWTFADKVIASADANKLRVNGLLMGVPPGSKLKGHTFPVDHLDGWSRFVTESVTRYKGRITHWEVWNEGNGGFNDGKHTTTDYARLAASAYAAGKAADPNAKIGLTVASYDPAYLHQAALAMAKEGKPGSFDFLAIHPYEIADGLRDPDGEIPFLWMSHRLRGLLKTSAPGKEDVPIWITEIGQRLGKHSGRETKDADAAKSLVKLYVMALAQGIECSQWFEGRDPAGEEAGFGLLARDGSERATYRALRTLTKHQPRHPKYLGWLQIGGTGRGYGFVFEYGPTVLIAAWMPTGHQETVFDDETIGAADPLSDRPEGALITTDHGIELTDSPQFVFPAQAKKWIDLAKANAAKPFPWGGDYSAANEVSVTLGQTTLLPMKDAREAKSSGGVFHVGRHAAPTAAFPDGTTGIILRSDQSANFYAHPSFTDLSVMEYWVRVTVRRLAPGNLGMNLYYEQADTQGKMPYKNAGTWFAVPAGDGWHTFTWHVKDACFAKMWGYDLSIKAEQSVPFVLGKVEVSKVAFR